MHKTEEKKERKKVGKWQWWKWQRRHLLFATTRHTFFLKLDFA
jgi:hypothetical protein